MGERPDRPDELRRDPLGRPDPLGEESERGVDPADARDIELEPPPPPFDPETASPDPALAGAPVGGTREVDEVEASRGEIEHTRTDMSETVDAIQNKFSPRNLKEQAKEQAKDTAKGTGSTIMETIRENPLPAALTGIGLGWLFVSARRSSSSSSEQEARYRGDRGYDYPPAYDHVPPDYDYPPRYEERGTSGPSTGQALEQAQGRAGETASQARDRAGQAASQLGSRAQEQARRAKGGFQRMLEENPLAVGALAVGAGAAVGLAIPQSAKEHEAMGEARDSLVERAQEKAQDVQQRAQRVAEEAQSAAKEETQNQDLT
jgi:gas vesicle protein